MKGRAHISRQYNVKNTKLKLKNKNSVIIFSLSCHSMPNKRRAFGFGSTKNKSFGGNYIFKILYMYIVLPCLFQSLAVPLVLGKGPNEKSEQKPREAEVV